VFGLTLFSLGILLAVLINWLVVFVISLGFIGDIVVYGIVLKRRTPLSIIFGGIAGGMPALAGWSAFTNSIELGGILLALLVMAWIPAHILTLAMFHVEDYKAAQVPMLPVVVSPKRTREIIILSNLIFGVLAFGLYFFDIFGKTYLVLSIIPTFLFLFGSIRILVYFSKERYWTLFKISGPYLLVLYIAMIIDVLAPIF
jgi:protoheme IX farnesyltransferase